MEELYSFVQKCAKVHSIKFKEYLQCDRVQELCVIVTH